MKPDDPLLTVADCNRLAACVRSIGTHDFPSRISALCVSICQAQSVYLCGIFADVKPIPLYSSHQSPEILAALEFYIDFAYVLDPFVLYFREGNPSTVMRLRDIAPDRFRHSDYYRKFYRATGLNDECGMLIRFGPDAAIFLSMGVHGGCLRTRPERLEPLIPLVESLLRRHWRILTPENTDGTRRMARQVERAFRNFGATVLSPREAEILRMVLRGHSSKSIARDLNNSPETIKVHRRRAYAKLGVTSQGELLALFVDAISRAPDDGEADPLAYVGLQDR